MISRERLLPVEGGRLLERAAFTHENQYRTHRCGQALGQLLGQLTERVEDTYSINRHVQGRFSFNEAVTISGLIVSTPRIYHELPDQPNILRASSATLEPVLFTNVRAKDFTSLAPGGMAIKDEFGIFLEVISNEEALKGATDPLRAYIPFADMQAYAGY